MPAPSWLISPGGLTPIIPPPRHRAGVTGTPSAPRLPTAAGEVSARGEEGGRQGRVTARARAVTG